jgi:hypothetical protein
MSLNKPVWIFKSWLKSVDYKSLSSNTHPSAIEFLGDHTDLICWYSFSSNPAAIDVLEKNLDKIRWEQFNCNPTAKAIEILRANPERINWDLLSKNPAAVELLAANRDKVNLESLFENSAAIRLIKKMRPKRLSANLVYALSGNHSMEAMRILKANFGKLRNRFDLLVQNPFAADLIMEHFDKFDSLNKQYMALNTNPVIINMVKGFPQLHVMQRIADNPAVEAFELIESMQDAFISHDWAMQRLWKNPNIFTICYPLMKRANKGIREELTDVVMHPDWIARRGGLNYLKDLFD